MSLIYRCFLGINLEDKEEVWRDQRTGKHSNAQTGGFGVAGDVNGCRRSNVSFCFKENGPTHYDCSSYDNGSKC